MVSDADLAGAVAGQAGQLLLAIRDQRSISGSSAPSADLRSDELIADLLRTARPGDAVLSEEIGSSGDRFTSDRVWIIDPLDGTREYGEVGRSDWAVHVALWAGGELTAGAVAIPDRGELWSTSQDAAPIRRPIVRIAVSRSRPPQWAPAVADRLGAELVPMGSAGAKVAAILRGEADAYLHDGGQYEWDSAAPVAVARHYGLSTTRADGQALRYNQPDPYLPDLVIAPAPAAANLLGLIAAQRGSDPRAVPAAVDRLSGAVSTSSGTGTPS